MTPKPQLAAVIALAMSAATLTPPAMSQTPPSAEPKATPVAAKKLAPTPADAFTWLEEVQGEQALSWVKERNVASAAVLQARPEFAPAKAKVLEILNSKDKIPYINRIGAHVYNLWTDEKNQRGLWRRTTLAEYQKASPAWEVVLDIDALGAAEKESWVWGGADCFAPEYTRCLLSLSRGGSDASVVREFDLSTKTFVAGGFAVPEAKSDLSWKDANTLYVGTDFGPGSMTKSGYPRVIKEWQRGTPLSAAKTVFEAKEDDVYAYAWVSQAAGYKRASFGRGIDFYNTEVFMVEDGKQVRVDKPSDASFSPHQEWATLSLKSDWVVGGKTYRSGSLLIAKYADYMAGKRNMTVLFEPTATTSLAGFTFTKDHIILDLLDNVKSRLVEWTTFEGKWISRRVQAPENGSIGVSSFYDPTLPKDPLANSYLMTYKDFLTPDSLMLAQAGADLRQTLKQLPQRFDATGMRVEQHFAKSKDGTKVPYFVVSPKPSATQAVGTPGPTLLYGYGGFQVSEQPWYSGSWGNNWLIRGGTFVLANIRGGGEFGPAWHQAGIKAKKQRSYDDFAAIAEDLIERKITTPQQLGIMGGSNGGLLVGATFTQRPELFNAVVCQVPLLDMRKYHTLLAGNSWVAEYGDPDNADEWAFIRQYSPYHNLLPSAKNAAEASMTAASSAQRDKTAAYPRVFFNTSTKDDRVHPAHARKMVARMQSLGHDVLYFENIEGGHGGAADNTQRAHLMGLEFAYLWMQLGAK